MARPAERIPTFDELYEGIAALPDGVTGEILVDGRIDAMGRPGHRHTRAAKRLARALGEIEDDDERDGWVIEPEREIRLLGERLVVPDLAGWRVSPDDEPFLDDNPVLRRPDWACEILSPTTEARDRRDKLPLHARAGVAHVWLVDPDRRVVEVFETRAGAPVATLTARDADVARLPPFERLGISLAGLWGPADR